MSEPSPYREVGLSRRDALARPGRKALGVWERTSCGHPKETPKLGHKWIPSVIVHFGKNDKLRAMDEYAANIVCRYCRHPKWAVETERCDGRARQ